MKYISFAIPCYNSEAYMEKAINSILAGGEDVEIIVVNDGSKDSTQAIAERYQEKYPTIVKASQQGERRPRRRGELGAAPCHRKIF